MIVENSFQSISLSKSHLTSTSTTRSKCLTVYQQKKKVRQRIAAGDKTGAVRVFSIGKSQDLAVAFETPITNSPVGRTTVFNDQLFFTHGATIEAYSRKGRLFFTFESGATEALTKLFISTPFIFAAGEYILSSFEETRELGFVMTPDRINDMEVLSMPVPSNNSTPQSLENYTCVVGCHDRQMRVVRNNTIYGETGTEAAITVVHAPRSSSRVWYGTNSGSFGYLKRSKATPYTLVSSGTSIIPEKRLSAVTAMATADIDQDGEDEVIVCREDGSIEVHSTRASDGASFAVAWKENVGESIQTVATGYLTNVEHIDAVIHTFSGSILTFSHRSEPANTVAAPSALDEGFSVTVNHYDGDTMKGKRASGSMSAEPEAAEVRVAQIRRATADIEVLRAQISQQAEELATTQLKASTRRVANAAAARAVASTFVMRCTMEPVGTDAALRLTVAADAPLDCVAIQSDIPLRLVASEATHVSCRDCGDDCSHITVSPVIAQSTHQQRTRVLAVARPTEAKGHQVQMDVWASEGCSGTIRAIVLPTTTPKTAQTQEILVRPLHLYARCGIALAREEPENVSVLRITGGFSSRDMHSWLYRVIPGVPEVFQPVKKEPLAFQHTYDGTTLLARYGEEGVAVFESNSLSALIIVSSALMALAADRQIAITKEMKASYLTPYSHLRRILPKVAREGALSKKLKLVHGLRDLQGNEEDVIALPKEYQELLASAADVEREGQVRQQQLAQVVSLVSGILKATCSALRGTAATNEALMQLEGIISRGDCTMDALVPLFFPNKEHIAAMEAQEHLAKQQSVEAMEKPTVHPASPAES